MLDDGVGATVAVVVATLEGVVAAGGAAAFLPPSMLVLTTGTGAGRRLVIFGAGGMAMSV